MSATATTALLVIDYQVDVAAECISSVTQPILTAIAKARAANVPVVWIQHSDDELVKGSPGWEFTPELAAQIQLSDARIYKTYGDSFEDTPLKQTLDAKNINHVVLCGAQTDMCVQSTFSGAFVRGYNVTVVGDAHTTGDFRQFGAPISGEDAIKYWNMLFAQRKGPGRVAKVVNSDELAF